MSGDRTADHRRLVRLSLVVCLVSALILPGLLAAVATGAATAAVPEGPAMQEGTANGTATPATGSTPTATPTPTATGDGNRSTAATVTNLTFVGQGRVDDVRGRPAILGAEEAETKVGLWTGNESGTFIVCTADRDRAGDGDAEGTLGCRRRNLPNGTAATLTFPGETLGNRSGLVNLTVSLSVAGVERTELDRVNVSVYVFERSADFDGDGLPNAREFAVGADPTVTDTDRDGLADGPEVRTYGTDPTSADTDGDGRRDGTEIREGTDPNRADATETPPSPTPTATPTPTPAADSPAVSMGLLAGLLAVVPLVVVGYLVVRRRSGAGAGPLADRQEETVDAPSPGRSADRSTTAASGSGDAGGDAGGRSDTARPPDVPDAVISDEERVLNAIEEADGRLPQQTLVQQFDWSKSKVSRVTSRLADRDELIKLQVGRRNLLVLPGEEPASHRDRAGGPNDRTGGPDEHH
jgi:hypothetical protein